jgi:hypothetical protein
VDCTSAPSTPHCPSPTAHPLTPQLPIAHPALVANDPSLWAQIEEEGLGGFTGVTPLLQPPYPSSPSDPTAVYYTTRATRASPPPPPPALTEFAHPTRDAMPAHACYAVDARYAGEELRRWAGVQYVADGGEEVQRMVRGLWDERGWECLWVSDRAGDPGDVWGDV